ncbi:hypothetical protein JCM8547_008524 [Rhodosporidiobolus lusitaniae]
MASTANFAASKLFSVKGLTAFVTGGGTGIDLMATQDNASKAAAVHLTRLLATEFAYTAVRVNTIAPGPFPSEMTRDSADERNKFDPKTLNIPAGRAGDDKSMGGTFLYLASRAGQYTNGAIIPLDGGALLTNPSAY